MSTAHSWACSWPCASATPSGGGWWRAAWRPSREGLPRPGASDRPGILPVIRHTLGRSRPRCIMAFMLAAHPLNTLRVLRLSLALATVLFAGCAGSASEPVASNPVSTPAGNKPAPTREVLPNGVVLITQEHRAADVVALQLWVRVGGRDELPDELGLSHYLEHMLFKGTPTRPVGSIDRLIEGLGGTSNAFTSYDYTHFDVVLPAAQMRAGVELLPDHSMNARLDAGELDGGEEEV